jgi:hypothetical protein
MSLEQLSARLDAEHSRSAKLANLQLDYDKTLILLRALKLGEITVKDFEMVGDGWKLVEPFRQATVISLE